MSRQKSQYDNKQLENAGLRIKAIREEAGLSQAEFGKTIGISGNYVSDLEKGKVEPKRPVLLAIEYRYAIKEEFILTGAFPKFIPKKDQETPRVAEGDAEGGAKSVEVLADTIRYYAKTTERLNAELREKDRWIAKIEQIHKAVWHAVEVERPPDGVEERRHCIQFIKKVLETG